MKTGIMKNRFQPLTGLYLFASVLLISSCSVSKPGYTPSKKYSPERLNHDYSVFRGVLEESHPGLYWYTPKKEMDSYFDWGKSRLTDSLTETEFRHILNYILARINCGHTITRPSKAYLKYRDTSSLQIFPLSLKIWSEDENKNDTAVVAANLDRKDSILKRGVVIKRIDGRPLSTILDTLSRFISSDGYNLTHKYQVLSNRGGFGSAYTSVFGRSETYYVDYLDSTGTEKRTAIQSYNPRTDSLARSSIRRFERRDPAERRRRIRFAIRNLQVDSVTKVAYMNLSSFGRNLRLRSFYRSSFRTLKEKKIASLVIDVRGNGGGSVSNSTMLTKYIIDKKFKVADTLYALTRYSRYRKYIQNYFLNRLFMLVMTGKKRDGHYHFGYFERHFFKPKKKNHYEGQVYVLTGGNSFSATSLFAETVREQQNVLLAGEETGGGAYGNTAWLIPDVTLPETGVRFRLPLFRLVIDKNIPKNGRGVLPELEIKPTTEAIRLGQDYKMKKVLELINNQY